LHSTLGTAYLGCTDSGGTAVGTLNSITETGQATLTVPELAELSGDTLVSFTPGPPVQFRATAATTQLHANGYDTTPVTFTLQDNYENPVVAGFTVHQVENTLGDLSCPSKTTDATGSFYCTFTAPTETGTASFSVKYRADQPLINNGSDTIDIFIGQASYMIIDPAGPLTVTAGVTTPFIVDVYDSGGALVPPSRLTHGWFQVYQGGNGTFYPVPPNSRETSFVGEGEGALKVRVSIFDNEYERSLVPGTVSMLVQPAPPVEAAILVAPAAVPADGSSTFTVTLSLFEDIYNNTALDGEQVTVRLGTEPTQLKTATIVGDQLQVAFESTTRADTYPITVTNRKFEQLTLYGDAEVTFTPGPPAQAVILAANPPQVIADGVSTSTVTVQIQDIYSNSVAAGWPVALSSNLGSLTLSGSGLTTADGLVTATLQAGLEMGQALITATHALSDFLASGTVLLTHGPPVSATISAEAGQTTLAAGGDALPLQITVEDAWHHPVSGVVISSTVSPELARFAGSGEVEDGETLQLLAPYTRTGQLVVDIPGLAVTGDLTYTIVPNVAALAFVEASPTDRVVGETSLFTITVTDAYSNIVPPTEIVITSTLNGTIDGVASPVTRTTLSDPTAGQAFFSLVATEAGSETLALAGPAGPITVRPGSTAVTYRPDEMIIVTLDHTGTITWMAGVSLTVMASSRDRFGNIIDPWEPITYYWEQTSLTNNPGYGKFTELDPYLRTVDFVPFKVGSNQIRAINAQFSSDYLTVTVIAAPPTRADILDRTSSVRADNVSTTTVLFENLVDVYGNDVTDGHVVTVTVDGRQATGVVSGGQAAVVMTATTTAGTHSISAVSSAGPIEINSLPGYDEVIYLPGPPALAVVEASQTLIPADVGATLVLTVYDQYSNLVSDGTFITVTLDKAQVGGDTSPTINGLTSRSLIATGLGNSDVLAEGSNGSLFLQGDTRLTFVPGSAKIAVLTAQSIRVPADGTSFTRLDFDLKDGAYFPVESSGTAVITVSRGSVLPTITVVTDGSFNTTFLSETEVGPVDIEILYNDWPLVVDGDTVTLVPGPPYSATVTATPDTIEIDSGQDAQLRFELFDAWNNPLVDPTPVTVTTSLGSVSPVTDTTTGNTVTTTLSYGTVAGTATFTVAAEGAADSLLLSGDTVEILPGPIHRLKVFPDIPVWVDAGNSIQFSATGYDQYDNITGYGPFNWRKVYGSGNGLLLAQQGLFTGTIAGPVGIQAYTGTVYSPEKAITVVPGPVYTTMVYADPLTVPVGGVPSLLRIVTRDYYGNLVTSGTSASISTDLGQITGSGTAVNGVFTRTLLSQYLFRAGSYIC
jgi:adhesin/invasin